MAELADDWPSLAPIRTSCSTSSSGSFHSIASSGSHHLSLARRSISTERSFPSPPSSSASSSSSHLKSFLSSNSTRTSKGPGLLSKCLPPRHINPGSHHGFPRQSMSGSPAARVQQRAGGGGAAAAAGAFRSYASFPGAQGSASSAAPAAAAASANLTSHSGPLHGNVTTCNGHLINLHSFTMIPAAAVGKKKPPDYLSDEPTSPEVTCIGRVRKSKNSNCAWDALNANGSEKLPKKKKKKTSSQKTEHPNARDMDLQLAASIPRPLCMDSSITVATIPKWRKIISLFKDIRDLHTPHLQIRKFRPEDFMINLDQLRHTTQRRHIATALPHNENRIDERETEINAVSREVLNYLCPSGEGGGDLDCATGQAAAAVFNDVTVQGADPPVTVPPPNACLLLIKSKSGRNKVFHDENANDHGKSGKDDDKRRNVDCPRADPPSHHPALKTLTPSLMDSNPPSASHPIHNWNKKQASSFWKSKTLNSALIKAFVR